MPSSVTCTLWATLSHNSVVCSLQCVFLVRCVCAFPLVLGCIESSLTRLNTPRSFMSLCASCALVLLYSLCGTKAFWPVRVRPQPHWVQGNAARPMDISIYEPHSCFCFVALVVFAFQHVLFRVDSHASSSLWLSHVSWFVPLLESGHDPRIGLCRLAACFDVFVFCVCLLVSCCISFVGSARAWLRAAVK